METPIKKHSILKNYKPVPAQDGLACPLCVEMARIDLLAQHAKARVEDVSRLPLKRRYNLIKYRAKKHKDHPQCKDCGIFFGGYHLESPNKDGVCSSCEEARAKAEVSR